jgi:macrolide-specific efflux system membrane fusion protein
LIQPDGTEQVREVVVGAMDRVNAEVISGLQEGDKVVAGVIQARVEPADSNNNNRNNSSNFRMIGGGGFRPF